MENVRLVSDLFKQCFTLFNRSVGQRGDVECATVFIIRNVSEDHLKHALTKTLAELVDVTSAAGVVSLQTVCFRRLIVLVGNCEIALLSWTFS